MGVRLSICCMTASAVALLCIMCSACEPSACAVAFASRKCSLCCFAGQELHVHAQFGCWAISCRVRKTVEQGECGACLGCQDAEFAASTTHPGPHLVLPQQLCIYRLARKPNFNIVLSSRLFCKHVAAEARLKIHVSLSVWQSAFVHVLTSANAAA